MHSELDREMYQLILKLPAGITQPNHYELLGLPNFTDDLEKIRSSAIEQNSKALKWQNTKGPESLVILREIAEAMRVLLDPPRKRAYDRSLGRKLDQQPAEETVELHDTKPSSSPTVAPPPLPARRKKVSSQDGDVKKPSLQSPKPPRPRLQKQKLEKTKPPEESAGRISQISQQKMLFLGIGIGASFVGMTVLTLAIMASSNETKPDKPDTFAQSEQDQLRKKRTESGATDSETKPSEALKMPTFGAEPSETQQARPKPQASGTEQAPTKELVPAKKISEPEWLAVEDMMATPGRFILELPPSEPVAQPAAQPAGQPVPGFVPGGNPFGLQAPAQTKRPVNSRGVRYVAVRGAVPFKKQLEAILKTRAKPKPQNPNNRPIGPGGRDEIFRGGAPIGPSMGNFPGQGRFNGGEPRFGGMAEGPDGMRRRPIGGQEGEFGPGREIKGPETNSVDPFELLKIRDFEIQRQEIRPSSDPPSNDEVAWITLDIGDSLKVLEESADYDDDFVDLDNMHFVISSPLPKRLVGRWSSYFAGHPKIQTLTEEQIGLQRILNEELLRMQSDDAAAKAQKVGGFAKVQRDVFGLRRKYLGNRGLIGNVFNRFAEEQRFAPPPDLEDLHGTPGKTPVNLLFRYFDFDVEPNQAYRYRVRIKLENPHHGEAAAKMADPSVAEGAVRLTPWSAPTPPARVPVDAETYLVGITPAEGRKETRAQIDLYQWLPQTGTTAHKILEIERGRIIGQPKPPGDGQGPANKEDWVQVLRPHESFKGEPIELNSSKTVVDFTKPASSDESQPDFHADLDLPVGAGGEIPRIPQALIVDSRGQLQVLSPHRDAPSHKKAAQFLASEYKPWEHLKPRKNPQSQREGNFNYGGGLDDFEEVYSPESFDGRGNQSGRTRGPRKSNPLRRSR